MKRIALFCTSLAIAFQVNAIALSMQKSDSLQTSPEVKTGLLSDVEFSVTIIGSGSPQYNPERSGPSALVQFKGAKFLIDMGNGTRAQLEKPGLTKRNAPDALMITHHHLDHNEEFIPMVHQKMMSPDPFLIAGPAPIQEMTNYVAKFYNEDLNYRLSNAGRSFDANNTNATVKELKGDETFEYKGVTVSSTEVPHSIYTLAYRFDANGKSIVISGDLTYSPKLSALAKDADILVIDSQIVHQNAGGRAGNGRTSAHATIEEAAKMAKDANVKTLIITHLGKATIDVEATKAKIAEQFKGKIFLAEDFLTISTDGKAFSLLK
jgi:ribonuclease BN (tRNA processing enzyme)